MCNKYNNSQSHSQLITHCNSDYCICMFLIAAAWGAFGKRKGDGKGLKGGKGGRGWRQGRGRGRGRQIPTGILAIQNTNCKLDAL